MIEQYVSRQELRRLFVSLTASIGAILVFGLFASIVVPGLRNANRPEQPGPEAPLGTGWLDPVEYPPMRGYEMPPLDPVAVMAPTPELLARGKALFGEHCAQCHGAEGRGDGPAGASVSPRPRDFSREAGWTNGPGLAGIFKTLRDGVPRTGMVSYDFLAKKDRMALVHQVRSFGRFAPPAESPEAIAALERELAVSGERVPNRIPVSLAGKKLVAEHPAVAPIDLGPASPVTRLAVVDASRAARVLAAMPLWRGSPETLARIASMNAGGNGFRAGVATLSAADWQRVFADLVRATGAAGTKGQVP